ncbi:unnamed protein product [Miscanthus lutarioriparius]|uniref:BHLH domain-containing protein n=1 Tax=Miscanthus lutarioriparius TaxID=422564 RepID=A0A811PGK6_9POAL|nr:unnamed protein product [Miscanthus lutarioriparius]
MQISMRMNMDDEAAVYMSSNDGATTIGMHDPLVERLLDDPHHHAGTYSFPSSSSSSLSQPASTSLSCSPESSSAHILDAPAAARGYNQQYPEVSSHVPLLPPPPPVVPSYDHQYTNLHAPESPAKTTGAFKHYARHLGPKRPPMPGACGQRMFKTAMSVLSKMHVAERYSQQQYYYQAAAAAAEAVQPPSVNQLQHMFSERKRREKLNDSFHALKAVLPPGSKKDKTSILIRAREYVRLLEAKVAEVEEKNKSLESRLTRRDGRRKDGSSGGDDHDSGETTKVQVEITRAANEELCMLKIAVRSPRPPSSPNMTDVVVRTLQCLKEQIGDGVSLVAMSTSGGGAGLVTGVKNASPRAVVLTMQIKVQCRETRTPPLTEKEPGLDDTPPPVDPDTYDQQPTIVSRSQVKAARARMDQTRTPLAADAETASSCRTTWQQEKEEVSTEDHILLP